MVVMFFNRWGWEQRTSPQHLKIERNSVSTSTDEGSQEQDLTCPLRCVRFRAVTEPLRHKLTLSPFAWPLSAPRITGPAAP